MGVEIGGAAVLRDVSLAFPAGEVTALIGPSGSGKSSFLRCLNRLHDLNPAARVTGRVLLDGEDVRRLPPALLRRRVGMLFQRPNPFPMSIYENVAFGPRLHRLPDVPGRVEAALRAVGLWGEVRHRLEAPASRLSGGQQQRLCLARCLAVDPEVLLLDEPTSALDPAAAALVERLLAALAGPLTLVLVTHDLGQARRLSRFTAFFQGGRLREWGPTEAVFRNPQRPETARFVQ